MTTTLDLTTLLTPDTQESIAQVQLDILQTAGFPVTSWQATDPFRVMVTADAAAIVSLADYIPQIAAGGFVYLASGAWLTALASQNYEEERVAASFCKRVIRVTDAGVGSRSFNAGDIIVQSAAGLRYFSQLNADGTTPTLVAGSFVDVLFQGESTGSAYNASAGAWKLITAIAGIAIADAPLGVTVPGVDDQTDASLADACAEKWSTLGVGATDDAYLYNVTHVPGVMTQVSRATILRHTPLPGQVTILISGPAVGGVNGASSLSTVDVTSAVTQTGTGPAVSLTGTPLAEYVAIVQVMLGGIVGTATFRYSLDGGASYSGNIATAATYLIAGTGITLHFAAGTYVLATSYAWTSTLSVATKVQNYIDPPLTRRGKTPTCVDGIVQVAINRVIAIVGTVTAIPTEKAAAQSGALADLNAWGASADVGGAIELELIRTTLRKRLTISTRNRVVLSAPAADIVLAYNEVPIFDTTGLTWADG